MKNDVRARNHVTEIGRGERVLVLAHGFGCDQRIWRFVAADLARDHRIVLFDYVGSGRSDLCAWTPQRYGSLEGYKQDLIEVLDALRHEQVVLVAHSVSGSIGALASIDRPELFERLILVGPNPCFINDGEYVGGFERQDVMDMLDLMDRNMVGWADMLAPLVVKTTVWPERVAEMRENLCAGDPAIVRRFAEVVFTSDIRQHLPRIPVPVLIMQCADDAVAPSSVGDYLLRHIPRARLNRMAATGHCPHLSHPDETIALIRDDLRRPKRAATP